MEIIYQGNVALDGSTRIICNQDTLVINTIIINNILSNYTFTLTRNMTSSGIPEVLLYTFELQAEETLRDTETYTLNLNNFIELLSDVPGTTFYISATQI
jgi:hypothetical protein